MTHMDKAKHLFRSEIMSLYAKAFEGILLPFLFGRVCFAVLD